LPKLVWSALGLVRSAARRELTVSAGLQALAGIGVAGQVLLAREVLQAVLAIGGGAAVGGAIPILMAMAGLSALLAFASQARAEQQRILGELVARHAVDQVLEVSGNVHLLAFDSPSFHNRLQRAMVNAAARPTQMVTGVLGILSSALTIAGISVALIVIEPLFLVVVLLAYVPLWMATTRMSKIAYAFGVEQTERDRRRDYLSSVLVGREEAAEVRAFGLAPYFRARHRTLWDERLVELRVLARRRLRFGAFGGLVTSLLTAGIIFLLVLFVSEDRLGLAEAGAAATALVFLAQRLQTLTSSIGSLYESSLFVEDFTTFVEAMPGLLDSRGDQVPPVPFEQLEVDSVSFTYPSRTEPALRDISLTINRGEVVALVGENGSGKTTLAKLLAGLYAPSKGSVRWDGVELSECDPDRVRAGVGVIFQDFVTYALTAHENVSVGRVEDFDDRVGVESAAVKAGADEFLASLPDGYDSKLGAEFYGGSDLSLGQWQRLALARAYFRDAPFLILDEPSASMDARGEAALFERIRELYAGRTVLLVSHRFSTVRSADRIVVMERGQVAEQGTHIELMAHAGLYAELFTLQASAYVDSESI
jgi:ATP-binding cassette subfamily B protein